MNFQLSQNFQIKGKTQTDTLGLKNITENKKLLCELTSQSLSPPPQNPVSAVVVLALTPGLCFQSLLLWFLLNFAVGLMLLTCDCSCHSSFPKPIRGSFLTEELRFLCQHRYPLRFYCAPSIQVTSPVSPQNPFYSSQATHPSLTLSFFKFFFFFLSIRNGNLQFFLIIPPVFTGRNLPYLSRPILECDLLDEALIYLYNHDYCLLLLC